MGARLVSKLILAVIALAMACFGVAFAGFAIWAALTPSLGEAWAAAITAFIFLVGPLGAAIALGTRRRRSFFEGGEGGVAGLFGLLARERPLMLLFGAALLGVAETFLKKRK